MESPVTALVFRVPRDRNHTTELIRSVQNVAFADAAWKARPKPWTRRLFKLYGCLFLATINSCVNGYDGSLMSAINEYEQYRGYFGFPLDRGTAATGIVYAIYTIGNLVGSFFAGPATDLRGRKWGIFTGSLIIILGAIIQATGHSLAQFMCGRFTLGFGVAITSCAGPTYVSELAHPSYRGLLTGVYNTFWFVGGIPGTFIPYGTNKFEGSISWRIPIWCQMIGAGIVLISSPFLPETPRWLMAHNRQDEALDVMARYHGEGDRNSPIVQLEYREMVEDIAITGSDKRWWDYRELFNSKETRYRSMLVIAMAFFGQWSGNGPISYYYPQMLRVVGVTDRSKRLLYNGAQNVISFGGAITGAIFTDKWGRRKQLLVSTATFVLLFTVICALNATNLEINPDPEAPDRVVAKSSTQAKGIIAFIFLFGFVWGVGYTPLQTLYPVECLRFESRAKGMGVYNFFVNIAGFYNTFVTEIAFTKAGWKYYFLFIFWDIFEFVCIYVFFVETRKRTLEELTEIFKSPNPVKVSLDTARVVLSTSSRGREVHELLAEDDD